MKKSVNREVEPSRNVETGYGNHPPRMFYLSGNNMTHMYTTHQVPGLGSVIPYCSTVPLVIDMAADCMVTIKFEACDILYWTDLKEERL